MSDEKRRLVQELITQPKFNDQQPGDVGHPYAGHVADWILALMGRIKRLDGQVREAERRLDVLASDAETADTRLDDLAGDTETFETRLDDLAGDTGILETRLDDLAEDGPTRLTISDVYNLKKIFDPDDA